MASLKSEIYALLEADAQLTGAGKLGSWLAMSTTAPYGVYYRTHPDSINFDTYEILTYFISSQVAVGPPSIAQRDIYLNITAWGKDFDSILDRVYDLLHNISLTTTDYKVLEIKWDFAGPESFDEFNRVDYRQDRYKIKAIKV